MSTLIFMDGAYTVVTNSWSASAKGDKNVVLCYTWQSPISNEMSCERMDFEMPIADFIHRIKSSGPICDFRT